MFSGGTSIGSATAAVLIVSFIVTGSLLTLSTKWADITSALGSDGTFHKFNHPLIQTWSMFIGEALCFFAYWTCFHKPADKAPLTNIESSDAIVVPDVAPAYSVWIFALPAALDFLASTIMGFGLILTYSSTFQMLRGSLVLFTALLSLIFLGRRLFGFQWTGLTVVILGLALVGVSAALAGAQAVQAPNPILGNILIISAQVIVATQMVVEEHYLGKYHVPPMLVVGWEGIFGFAISSIVIIIAYWIPGWSTEKRLEHAIDAFTQIGNSSILAATFFGSIIAVAFFNFFGMTITKYLSATTRTVVDSTRTVIIWVVALGVKWESFQYLQPVGFGLLVIGFFVYYGTIPMGVFGCPKPAPNSALVEANQESNKAADAEAAEPLNPKEQ
jgi:drug/metabolite transporter (DMT)-like permease